MDHPAARAVDLGVLAVDKCATQIRHLDTHLELLNNHVGGLDGHVERISIHAERVYNHVERIRSHVEGFNGRLGLLDGHISAMTGHAANVKYIMADIQAQLGREREANVNLNSRLLEATLTLNATRAELDVLKGRFFGSEYSNGPVVDGNNHAEVGPLKKAVNTLPSRFDPDEGRNLMAPEYVFSHKLGPNPQTNSVSTDDIVSYYAARKPPHHKTGHEERKVIQYSGTDMGGEEDASFHRVMRVHGIELELVDPNQTRGDRPVFEKRRPVAVTIKKAGVDADAMDLDPKTPSFVPTRPSSPVMPEMTMSEAGGHEGSQEAIADEIASAYPASSHEGPLLDISNSLDKGATKIVATDHENDLLTLVSNLKDTSINTKPAYPTPKAQLALGLHQTDVYTPSKASKTTPLTSERISRTMPNEPVVSKQMTNPDFKKAVMAPGVDIVKTHEKVSQAALVHPKTPSSQMGSPVKPKSTSQGPTAKSTQLANVKVPNVDEWELKYSAFQTKWTSPSTRVKSEKVVSDHARSGAPAAAAKVATADDQAKDLVVQDVKLESKADDDAESVKNAETDKEVDEGEDVVENLEEDIKLVITSDWFKTVSLPPNAKSKARAADELFAPVASELGSAPTASILGEDKPWWYHEDVTEMVKGLHGRDGRRSFHVFTGRDKVPATATAGGDPSDRGENAYIMRAVQPILPKNINPEVKNDILRVGAMEERDPTDADKANHALWFGQWWYAVPPSKKAGSTSKDGRADCFKWVLDDTKFNRAWSTQSPTTMKS